MLLMYDEDGTQITNPVTLRAIEEAERISKAWVKEQENWNIDDDDDEEDS